MSTTSKLAVDVDAIIRAIRSVVGQRSDSIPLHEPELRGNEWTYVKDCLDSTYVSSIGRYVDRFETMLADYTGVARAVAVANGTVALQICLQLAGVARHDEVLVPSLSFVATANAVVHAGGVPHFVDTDEATLGMCPSKLLDHLADIAYLSDGVCINRTTGARIKGVVPMHTFGQPAEMDALSEIAARYRLTVVEDAAESMGTFYKGRHTGNFGTLSATSFNGNKIITTGGGGAILTNDAGLAERAKHLTTTAKVPHPWAFFHDEVGYNFRLPNLNAALGCAQMEELPRFVEAKRTLASRYAAAFTDVAGATFFREAASARSNYWLNTLILSRANADSRDAVLEGTNRNGLMTRPAWTLLHTLPMFAACPRSDMSISESLAARIINLPSSSNLLVHE